MATQVIMPKLSPTMEEGQLSRWLKKEGDKVSMGEPLAEIDTDKATMEMQALANGVLRKIIIKEGESAPLGQMIAVIGEPDEDISAILQSGGAAQKSRRPKLNRRKQPQPLPHRQHLPKSRSSNRSLRQNLLKLPARQVMVQLQQPRPRHLTVLSFHR